MQRLALLMLAASAGGFGSPELVLSQGAEGWMLLVMLALATLISEDLACIAAGLLMVEGRLDFLSGTAACLTGIFAGDVLLFMAGRWLGRPALKRAPFRWFLSPAQVAAASGWIRDNGPWVILTSRFLPGTRLPVYFAMGCLHARLSRFLLWFLLAVSLWTPLLVGFTLYLGEHAMTWFDVLQRHTVPGLVILGILIWVMLNVAIPALTPRGRRMLIGRWRRFRHWEFWPAWLFYVPLLPYLLWLGVRHGSPFVFTAANPAIPAAGFVSEPKHKILEGLAHAAPFVARWVLLPGKAAGERRAMAEDFMASGGIDFPVVLKPDKGQRGAGVRIIRDEEALKTYLDQADYDLLLQEYVPGHEFGLFYARIPGESRGRVFSITEKRMLEVQGDGASTLEQLILRDERAVCMAPVHLERHRDRLRWTPDANERVPLVELGTHCRGAVFLDGGWLWSEALEARIESISRGFEGFWFGRYDVRAPDVDALRAGRGFRIVELNGVTAEAAHVYDPANSLGAAYRALGAQWALAFEIGAANRTRGAKVSGIRELASMWWHYRGLAARYRSCESL